MGTLIPARTLKGFRDYLPQMMIPRERIMEIARRVYRSYGFVPIDTPALEYLEILAGKGSEETDKQLYRFQDHGGRWVALRFDLTVPAARFTAQHLNELGTPFKRYHIAPVWRGENTQRGRYREFVQCDFDTIGTHSLTSDIETTLVIHDLLRAIGFREFTIRINNRRVLNGLLERLGLSDRAVLILRALDKWGKIGSEGVKRELEEVAGLTAEQAAEVLRLTEIHGDMDEVLSRAERLVQGSAVGEEGVAELREVVRGAVAGGVARECLIVDLAIARGLDYYTGTIYETFLAALPGIGSVCSGGRYDNLAALFTTQPLPGVGASLGLDRLLAAMEELGMLEAVSTTAPVFIVFFDHQHRDDYLRLAAQLRTAGLAVELYPEPKKLAQQLKYADRRGHRVAILIGEDEFRKGVCQVKDLKAGTQSEVPLDPQCSALIEHLQRLLG
ncbi:MAG TPA: histidine--tRNA ligase [Thermogutta sp.]|nr:histidine--tRNA ligase [Thermogutta sp.]HQF13131.1 histidine--tRNA ligase [Thermogutta sp.]